MNKELNDNQIGEIASWTGTKFIGRKFGVYFFEDEHCCFGISAPLNKKWEIKIEYMDIEIERLQKIINIIKGDKDE